MAKRDGVILELCWVHADATHNRFDQFITFCRQECAEDIPGATLSVNMKIDQTEALVKVTALPVEFDALPGVVRNAIIRIYTEADLDAARAMISDVAWTGDPYEGAPPS